jgi:putative ABC transport system substrate-binding protein
MVTVGDPVGMGVIASLAKPGGNVTGVSSAHEDFSPKLLGLLREVVPGASRIAYLDDMDSPAGQIFWGHIQAAGRTLGVLVQVFSVTKPEAVEPQLAAMSRARIQGDRRGTDSDTPYQTAGDRRVCRQKPSSRNLRWPGLC